MGLSGGMDSVTLLAMLLRQGYEVTACNFVYGSKHNAYEHDAMERVLEYYHGLPVTKININLRNTFQNITSDLLLSGGDIPEGHYEDESMSKTVVPGRNLIFTSIMAAIAESIGAKKVALGIHSGDHAIYPDCRPEFLDAADKVVYTSSDKQVGVVAPFLDWDKTRILSYGYDEANWGRHINGVLVKRPPYNLTRTCYKDQQLSCGKCGSCQERLEAFKNINKHDPLLYQDHNDIIDTI